ncbi:MAG: iron-sulfur cluster assembly scaffold protein [Chlamydiales bacterium]
MTLARLTSSFPWAKYSRKLMERILKPRSQGVFLKDQALERGMRLITGEEGAIEDGNYLVFYWLVDPDDGIIVDARYQMFGQSALIGAAEAACDLCVGKNYDQAHRLSADLIDKHFRDRSDSAAFPNETIPHMNMVISAIDDAAQKCYDIPLSDQYVAPPVTASLDDVIEGGYPGWETLSQQKKLALVEQVLDADVRPYIALDAGGVIVKDIKGHEEIYITYEGNCTSCMSSVGATLSYIQQVLRNKIYPTITVIPEL